MSPRARELDPIALEVFRGLYVSVCEEMGIVLMRSASSPNIKERRDYSCALFDAEGRTIAQGDHMPVHLGAMPASVAAALESMRLGQGDVAMLNDPFHGGSHLPDITLVAPVFVGDRRGPPVLVGDRRGGPVLVGDRRGAPVLVGDRRGAPVLVGDRRGARPLFHLAVRAHHADVGGISPGSMPLATEIYQEGLIIPPVRLVRSGRVNGDLLRTILANVRTPREREEDLAAQQAALGAGARRLAEIVEAYGAAVAARAGRELRAYSARMMDRALRAVPAGVYRFEDRLDDDGFGSGPIPIRAEIAIANGRARVDLRRSADQVRGGVNAVRAITVSAVLYVFRCLVGEDVPSNEGLSAPLHVLTRPGSILDARPPASVAAGNVETSQRIVDVVLGALARALPGKIPAASQGTMNNLALGGEGGAGGRPFAYYETLAGGMGARPRCDGLSGIHTHMTNSLNTPIEAIEQALPVRVLAYTLRRGSGGRGRFRGGDGIVRAIQALAPTQFSILSERRVFAPWGLAGGEAGTKGRNTLRRARGGTVRLPGKASGSLAAGDSLWIETPGGGGWGPKAPAARRGATTLEDGTPAPPRATPRPGPGRRGR